MSRAYDDMVADHVAEGWRVEQETSPHTLLAKGHGQPSEPPLNTRCNSR